MRIVINLGLMLISAGLVYVLAFNVNEPIEFQQEWDKREQAASVNLKQIRDAQKLYRSIKGEYTASFDTLADVLVNGYFEIKKFSGDPDAGQAVQVEMVKAPAVDSLFKVFGDFMKIDPAAEYSVEQKKEAVAAHIKKLRIVPSPETDTAQFKVVAKTINYQKTTVPVIEVSTPISVYMGKFADEKYKRYSTIYNPNAYLKFGDLYKPSLAGNWREQGSSEE